MPWWLRGNQRRQYRQLLCFGFGLCVFAGAVADFVQVGTQGVGRPARDDEAIGEIDIDGNEKGAFSDADRIELERLATAIAEVYPDA